MFKLLAFLLLALAAFVTSEGPEDLFSTPPTPPLEGGEVAQIPANDPKHVSDTQQVLDDKFKMSFSIDEILLYTTQVIDGLNTRVIFLDDKKRLLKVTWYVPPDGKFPQDILSATLFSLPSDSPGIILAEQETD